MNRFGKWLVLGLGGLLASIILAVYGQTAVQTIAGLAVAQTATQWNSVKDLAFGDNMTSGVLAAGCTLFDGTNFDRCRGDTTNGLDVDVTRVSGSVTVTGASTPADAYANPTTAVNTWSLLGCFNGTTWDRCLKSTHGDNLTTASGLNVAAIGYGWDGTNFDLFRALPNNADDGVASPAGILATIAYSYEFDGTTYDRVRNQFTQSTTGIVANGAGTAVNMTTTPMSKYTMIVDRTVGATDIVAINLECSIDGVIWPATGNVISVTTLAVEPTRNSAGDTPCQYMRYNVVTIGAGNTVTIQLLATR